MAGNHVLHEGANGFLFISLPKSTTTLETLEEFLPEVIRDELTTYSLTLQSPEPHLASEGPKALTYTCNKRSGGWKLRLQLAIVPFRGNM
jgi:hypothetical protein